MNTASIEIVPAILRKTFEDVQTDWAIVQEAVRHIQIDVTDGIFAGDGTFRDLPRLKQLPESEKIELHLMVQRPQEYIPGVIDLAPARCIFHIESFAGSEDAVTQLEHVREELSHTELALAVNPDTPTSYINDSLHLLNYVLFMGYNPGFAGQDINPSVFMKIGQFRDQHPGMRIAVDGHVGFDTVEDYVRAGARILCANSSIFKEGNPLENIRQLTLKAQSALL